MTDAWLQIEGTAEEIVSEAAMTYFRRMANPSDSDAAALVDEIYGALTHVERERAFDRDFVPAVEQAFNRLRLLGYRCEQDWQCCRTCGWDAIPWEDADHAVWYHNQDRENGITSGQVYLIWTGDPSIIREALEVEGLNVIHDGTTGQRILISLRTQ